MVGVVFSPAANTSTTDGTAFTAVSGSTLLGNMFVEASNTWTEVWASLPEAVVGFWIQSHSGSCIIHLAKGSVGNEVRFASVHEGPQQSSGFYVPIPQVAGTRISLAIVGGNKDVQLYYMPASAVPAVPSFTHLDVGPFACSTGSAGGVMLSPTVANTKTAWTEFSFSGETGNVLNGDSLPHQYKYLGLKVGGSGRADSADINMLVDLAYGPAASEVPFLENYYFQLARYTYHNADAHVLWMPWDRPAGDRISIRMQVRQIFSPGDSDEAQFFLYGLR